MQLCGFSHAARALRYGRLGIADLEGAPAALVDATRSDALAEWLPAALADVVAGLAALGGVQLQRSAVLSGWGLRAMAEEMIDGERETQEAQEDAQWGLALAGWGRGSAEKDATANRANDANGN